MRQKTLYTESPEEAAGLLRRGGTVAFATETVFGLGADAWNPAAVEAIFRAKQRPADNPLIVHVAETAQVQSLVREIPEAACLLMREFFPGPLSVILPAGGTVPPVVTAGLDTIAVRCPAHATAHAFLQACRTPVAAPSANRSGRPSPTRWEDVREDLDGRIDAVLTAGAIQHGLESTVVDCTATVPVLLRAGSTPLESLLQVLPDLTSSLEDSAQARNSPGTRHRHYAPKARVQVVEAPDAAPPTGCGSAVFLGLQAPASRDTWSRIEVFTDVDAYARRLFERFRECDRNGTDLIVCQTVPDSGVGRALNDRLHRAAASTEAIHGEKPGPGS